MWRNPGEPYEVELDGLKILCNPLSRGERKTILGRMIDFGEEENATDRVRFVDSLYEMAIMATHSIEGVKDVADFIDHQSTDQIIRYLVLVTRGGSISQEEEKNSASSSGA